MNLIIMEELDFSKLNISELKKICKAEKIEGYSKLKKQELVDIVSGLSNLNINDYNIDVEKLKKKEKPQVKRTEKLSKKLAKYINLDNYNELLEEYKNEDNINDIDLIEMVSEDIDKFINGLDLTDIKKYIDSYGCIKAVLEYIEENSIEHTTSEEDLYKELINFICRTDDNLYGDFIAKTKKHIASFKKKPSKKEYKDAPESEDDSNKKKASPKKPPKKIPKKPKKEASSSEDESKKKSKKKSGKKKAPIPSSEEDDEPPKKSKSSKKPRESSSEEDEPPKASTRKVKAESSKDAQPSDDSFDPLEGEGGDTEFEFSDEDYSSSEDEE